MTLLPADQATLDAAVAETQNLLTQWQNLVAGMAADHPSRPSAEAHVLRLQGALAEQQQAIAAL